MLHITKFEKVLEKTAFFALVFFIPVQLGRHFFPFFSFISGVRSDYLAPTVYLTDIVVLIFVYLSFKRVFAKRARIKGLKKIGLRIFTKNKLLLFALFYLLFNTVFISVREEVSFYKLIKIIEFIALFYAIVKAKPQLSKTVFFLSLASFYSSVLAIWQFVIQSSVGGLFWFFGERTFTVSTPGIALTKSKALSVFFSHFLPFDQQLFLRVYGSFSHPNVLAGFLAVCLPLSLYFLKNTSENKWVKLFYSSCLVLGLLALFLTYSKAGWLVGLFGFSYVVFYPKNYIRIRIYKKELMLVGFYALLLFSVFVFVFFEKGFWIFEDNWTERAILIQNSLKIILENPVFGHGLNSFLVLSREYVSPYYPLLAFQPVHNIYLLTFVETGLMGLFLLLLLISKAIVRLLQAKSIIALSFFQLLLLGLFDHYLFTLQQAQLLFVLFMAFAFMSFES